MIQIYFILVSLFASSKPFYVEILDVNGDVHIKRNLGSIWYRLRPGLKFGNDEILQVEKGGKIRLKVHPKKTSKDIKSYELSLIDPIVIRLNKNILRKISYEQHEIKAENTDIVSKLLKSFQDAWERSIATMKDNVFKDKDAAQTDQESLSANKHSIKIISPEKYETHRTKNNSVPVMWSGSSGPYEVFVAKEGKPFPSKPIQVTNKKSVKINSLSSGTYKVRVQKKNSLIRSNDHVFSVQKIKSNFKTECCFLPEDMSVFHTFKSDEAIVFSWPQPFQKGDSLEVKSQMQVVTTIPVDYGQTSRKYSLSKGSFTWRLKKEGDPEYMPWLKFSIATKSDRELLTDIIRGEDNRMVTFLD